MPKNAKECIEGISTADAKLLRLYIIVYINDWKESICRVEELLRLSIA